MWTYYPMDVNDKAENIIGRIKIANSIKVGLDLSPAAMMLIEKIIRDELKDSCVICGCNISLKGYCAGCQSRLEKNNDTK